MLELKKIAVTGGIASGKTTVCHLLKKHGAYQVSADEIIHQLLETNKACIKEVITLLGTDVLTQGKIDRKKVADKVFTDTDKLEKLETILHPLLLGEIEKEYQSVKEDQRYNAFVVELPLVQEIGKAKEFDCILAVLSDEARAKKRFAEKGFSKEEYERRMKRQWNISMKKAHATYTIINDGTLEELENQIKQFMTTLT